MSTETTSIDGSGVYPEVVLPRDKGSTDRQSSGVADRMLETGRGEQTVFFLHGLFGLPDNWRAVMDEMADQYHLVAPQFPIDSHPSRRMNGVRTIGDLTDYLEKAVQKVGSEKPILCGNSLGGLVAIEYCLRHPRQAAALVLTGSAGLYEANLAESGRPRVTPDWIRARTSEVFYDRALVTDDLVNRLHRDMLDRNYVRFVLRMARATRDHTVKDKLGKITVPTLLLWGRDDRITPPSVAEEFHNGIKHSKLVYIDRCGHSPNVEHPQQFSRILREFLADTLSACAGV